MGGGRYLYRLRYAEYLGALLSAQHVRRVIPIAVSSPALLLIFTVNLVFDFLTDRSDRVVLGVLLVAMLLLASIHSVRTLLGYALRHRLTVPGSIADKIRPEENWPGSRIASNVGGLWVVAVIVWLVALIGLAGLVSGELTPDGTPGG